MAFRIHFCLLECRIGVIYNLQSALDTSGHQPHDPRLDLGLIFLPPAATTNAFQQHQQAFRMVETSLYTIGKPHQRAVAVAIALKIQLNSIGYCSQFQVYITFLYALPRAGLSGEVLVAHGLFFISQSYCSPKPKQKHLSLGASADPSLG
jgi:hypothetical protein